MSPDDCPVCASYQWCSGPACRPPILIGAWRGDQYVTSRCSWCGEVGRVPEGEDDA